MALIDRKVNDWSQAVSSLDDKPKMTAAALKAAFDSNSNQLKPAINGIIDDLTGSQGALNIGLTPIDGLSGSNVQAVLQAISLLLKSSDVDISNLERLFTADGAALVGLQPISGVSASNLQQAIIYLADIISKVDPYLGNPVAISQGGTFAKDSQNALYNLGARPNKNLLDNPDFKINQRGKTVYVDENKNIITVDRWRIASNDIVTLEEDGVKISQASNNKWFSQNIENPVKYVGETLTFSAIVKANTTGMIRIGIGDNASSGTWGGNAVQDTLFEAGEIKFLSISNFIYFGCSVVLFQSLSDTNMEYKILAAKLEFGDKQTLARHLEDGSFKLLEKPDYATELLKCQRYQLVLNGYSFLGMGTVQTDNIVQFAIPIPTSMRLKNVSVQSSAIAFFDGTALYNGTLLDSAAPNNGCSAKFNAKFPDAPSGTVGWVFLNEEQFLILDANL